MGAIETASALAIVIGSVAYCCVKVIGQIESNKFKMCRCCGNECIRDVEEPTQLVEVEHALTHATHGADTSTNSIVNIDEEIQKTKKDRVFLPTKEGGINSPRVPRYPRPRLDSIKE